MNELASWLLSQRQEAKLSLPALAEKTKIMAKYLEALERGDAAALPTPFYARAFALAYARACGADEDEAIERVNEAFNAPGPAQKLAPAPAQTEMLNKLESAVLREKALGPWRLWLVVASAAVVFLLLLNAAVSCIRKLPSPMVAQEAAAVTPEITPQAATAQAQVVGEALDLRSRRPCWVVLEIDGKRLPTIFLDPNKRERWTVTQKAVMLAGNIGAVRVWWQGENLGYFGELGERMNGIVFETGKPWRKDPASDLALPPGVPSQAPH